MKTTKALKEQFKSKPNLKKNGSNMSDKRINLLKKKMISAKLPGGNVSGDSLEPTRFRDLNKSFILKENGGNMFSILIKAEDVEGLVKVNFE